MTIRLQHFGLCTPISWSKVLTRLMYLEWLRNKFTDTLTDFQSTCFGAYILRTSICNEGCPASMMSMKEG